MLLEIAQGKVGVKIKSAIHNQLVLDTLPAQRWRKIKESVPKDTLMYLSSKG